MGCRMNFTTLKRRSDFLHVRGGVYWVTPGFTLQARTRKPETGVTGETAGINCSRIGFTVTRRIGNAVVRNRIKRRLREIVRKNSDLFIRPDCDYVLIARPGGLKRRFEDLDRDLKFALKRVHDKLETRTGM